MLITCLLLVKEVWDVKPTYRKSWAGTFLMWSDLILGNSFKVLKGCRVLFLAMVPDVQAGDRKKFVQAVSQKP